MPIAGAFHVSVTGDPPIVPGVKRSTPFIFGDCTGEIRGLTLSVGNEVVWLLVKTMLCVALVPGTGTSTEAF